MEGILCLGAEVGNSGHEQLKAIASPRTWDGIVGKDGAQTPPEGRWLQGPWKVLGGGGHTQYCLKLSISAPGPVLLAASSQGHPSCVWVLSDVCSM